MGRVLSPPPGVNDHDNKTVCLKIRTFDTRATESPGKMRQPLNILCFIHEASEIFAPALGIESGTILITILKDKSLSLGTEPFRVKLL